MKLEMGYMELFFPKIQSIMEAGLMTVMSNKKFALVITDHSWYKVNAWKIVYTGSTDVAILLNKSNENYLNLNGNMIAVQCCNLSSTLVQYA